MTWDGVFRVVELMMLLVIATCVAAIAGYVIYSHAFPEPMWTDPAIEAWSEGC